MEKESIKTAFTILGSQASKKDGATDFRVLLNPQQKETLRNLSKAYDIGMGQVIRLLIGDGEKTLKNLIGYGKLRILSEQINSNNEYFKTTRADA